MDHCGLFTPCGDVHRESGMLETSVSILAMGVGASFFSENAIRDEDVKKPSGGVLFFSGRIGRPPFARRVGTSEG
jgi:hypothetical protein